MSVTSLVVAVRTSGASTLRGLGADFRRLRTQANITGRNIQRSMGNAGARGGLAIMNMARSAGQTLSQMGQSISSALAGGVSSAWQALPPQVKGAIVVAGTAMAAMLSGAIGAALNGLMLAAIGGGVLAAGVALAAKHSTIVRAAWADAMDPIVADVKSFAVSVLERPLVDAAKTVRTAWAGLSSDVFGALYDVAPALKPLVEGLARMAKEAMPGFRAAVKEAVPILRDFARMLPGIGRGISDFFQSLADGGPGAMKGLRLVVQFAVGALTALGNTIQFLSGQFDQWVRNAAGLTGALAKIPGIGRVFAPLAEDLARLNSTGAGAARSLDGVAGSAGPAADGTYRTADAARRAAEEMRRLSDQLHGLINTQLEADNAMLAWRQALDAVTASVRENGRQTDITKTKGQENVSVILQAVAAAERKRQADIALAGGEHASASAVAAANAKFREQLGALEALLYKLGFTKAQVDSLLGSYRALAAAPNITKTVTILQRGSVAGTGGGTGMTSSSGRAVPGFASGTSSAPRGWAWVGEEGPELMRMRGGEQVLSARQSAAAAAGRTVATSGTSRGGPVQLELVGASGGAFAEFVYSEMKAGRLRFKVRGNTVTV